MKLVILSLALASSAAQAQDPYAAIAAKFSSCRQAIQSLEDLGVMRDEQASRPGNEDKLLAIREAMKPAINYTQLCRCADDWSHLRPSSLPNPLDLGCKKE